MRRGGRPVPDLRRKPGSRCRCGANGSRYRARNGRRGSWRLSVVRWPQAYGDVNAQSRATAYGAAAHPVGLYNRGAERTGGEAMRTFKSAVPMAAALLALAVVAPA